MDRNTGKPRGFAFVEFSSPDEAAEAMEKFDGHELDGRQLRVNEAQERPRRPPMTSRHFSDGGGGGGGGYRAKQGRPKGSRRNLRGKKRSL